MVWTDVLGPKLLQQHLLRSLLHLQQLRCRVETFGAQHCLQCQRRAAHLGAVERHGHVLGTTTGAANDDLRMVEICYEIQIDRWFYPKIGNTDHDGQIFQVMALFDIQNDTFYGKTWFSQLGILGYPQEMCDFSIFQQHVDWSSMYLLRFESCLEWHVTSTHLHEWQSNSNRFQLLWSPCHL